MSDNFSNTVKIPHYMFYFAVAPCTNVMKDKTKIC